MNANYGKARHVPTRHGLVYGRKKQVSSNLQKLSGALQKRFKESFIIFYLIYT